MRHRDEVVLSADAADHAAVLERVRSGGAEQGRDHAGVEEARVAALQGVEFLVAAVELVDVGYRAHREPGVLLAFEAAQPVVERLRAERERALEVVAAAQARRFDRLALRERAFDVEVVVDGPGSGCRRGADA